MRGPITRLTNEPGSVFALINIRNTASKSGKLRANRVLEESRLLLVTKREERACKITKVSRVVCLCLSVCLSVRLTPRDLSLDLGKQSTRVSRMMDDGWFMRIQRNLNLPRFLLRPHASRKIVPAGLPRDTGGGRTRSPRNVIRRERFIGDAGESGSSSSSSSSLFVSLKARSQRRAR